MASDGTSKRIQDVLKSSRVDYDGIEPELANEEIQVLTNELLSAEVVNISRCEIKGLRIEGLAKALRNTRRPRRLRDLFMESNDIGNEEFCVLARAMKSAQLKSLERLNLLGNRIGEDGAKGLAKALKFLPALKSLKLQHNPIGVEGLKALASSFEAGHVPKLQELSIGHESIEKELCERRKEWTEQLVSTLESGRLANLEILDLWRFGDEGVQDVMGAFQSVEVKAQLKSLVLSRNSIGLEGVKQIARTLNSPAFSSLRKLFLNGNENMGDPGVLELAKGFESSNMEKLEHLSLRCTAMGEKGMVKMAELLKRGCLPSLQHLDITWNTAVTDASAVAFLVAYQKNEFLVAEISLDWPDQCLRDSADWHRRRNEKMAPLMKLLKNSGSTSATHGKVFLCGEGGAGKSRLRKSLVGNSMISLPEYQKQEHTRGIAVAHIEDGNVNLAVWDLAGQSEYQVLHSAFLPDLAFADGQATFFVIVCRLNFFLHEGEPKGLQIPREEDAKGELLYWLRYITSSSVKRMESLKRHVIVVLNSYRKGYQDVDKDMSYWKTVLDEQRKKFGEFLDIHPHPFVLDARQSKEVGYLKSHLFAQAQKLLQGRTVPRICKDILKKARDLSKHRSHVHFPVMDWSSFRTTFLQENHVNETVMRGAVDYLHEAGHLIYFREDSLKATGFPNESFVVLDPEWFCKEIVGNLLITQDMARHGEVPLRKKLQSDGSIRITDLLSHMPKLQPSSSHLVLALLQRLGLIYKLGHDKVFMPALFEDDKMRGWESPVKGEWVMGSSLVLKENEITILPVAIIRRFQVELGQGESAKSLTDFAAGVSHVTFKMDSMHVLVQFSGDGRNFKAGQERVGIRVDILVKPLVGQDDDSRGASGRAAQSRREGQVNLAQIIVEKLEVISKTCCPGVQFVRNVIKPWRAEDQCEMMDRTVSMSIEEVKTYVREGGLRKNFLNWTVGNRFVRAGELLCGKDLADLYIETQTRIDSIKTAAKQLGVPLVMSSNAPKRGQSQFEDSRDVLSDLSADHKGSATLVHVEQMLHRVQLMFQGVHEHIEFRHGDVMSALQELSGKLDVVFYQHQDLIRQVRSLEKFTIEERSNSVPRFVYPVRNDPKVKVRWKLTQILEGTIRESFKLRFLCEVHHKDGSLHEVDEQEGIDMVEYKPWLQKLAPCLEWSLRIAFIAVKVAGNVALPGIGLLFPSDLSFQTAMADAQFAQTTAQMLKFTESTLGAGLNRNALGADRYQGGSHEQELRGRARAHLKDLLGTFTSVQRQEKVGLRRVALIDCYHGSLEHHVVWICEPCLQAYEKDNLVKVLD